MTPKREKETLTFDLGTVESDSEDFAPDRWNWSDFKARVEKLVREAPKEFRDNILLMLDIDRGWESGDETTEVKIYWWREETDDEFLARCHAERQDVLLREKRIEDSERRKLAELQAKYGVNQLK